MGGIRAVLLNLECQPNFLIHSYLITGMRDKQITFKTDNIGAKYSDSTLQYFKDLQAGDKLLILNIICIGPDGNEWKLQPLEFTIIE